MSNLHIWRVGFVTAGGLAIGTIVYHFAVSNAMSVVFERCWMQTTAVLINTLILVMWNKKP